MWIEMKTNYWTQYYTLRRKMWNGEGGDWRELETLKEKAEAKDNVRKDNWTALGIAS